MSEVCSVQILSRSYFSITHLSSAALFATRAVELEPDLQLPYLWSATKLREYNACVNSSVMLAVFFVEAMVNEVFSDCADLESGPLINTIPEKNVMGALWRNGQVDRSGVLDKYSLALDLNRVQGFDKGLSLYQDMSSLIELRNALAHFKPETIALFGVVEKDIHKFEKRLKGRFPLNPLMGEGNAFYPDKVFGSGCANWAVKTAVAFVDEFSKKLGITPTYDHVRHDFGL